MRGIDRLKRYFSALKGVCHFAIPRSDYLIAGPYVGEFGYECMEWQSFVNAQVGRFRKVYVISYPGRNALYPECELIPHEYSLATAGYGYGSMQLQQSLKIARDTARNLELSSCKFLLPTALSQPFTRKRFPQRWIAFGEQAVIRHDIAFHFRNIIKEGPDRRINFPLLSADNLTKMCQEAGMKCVAIGHPEQSYCPPFCVDCRSLDLQRTIDAIGSVRFVAGQLSGPMHLASLCKKDIITWADGANRIAMAKQWNPHGMRIHVITDSAFDPDPLFVFKYLERVVFGGPKE